MGQLTRRIMGVEFAQHRGWVGTALHVQSSDSRARTSRVLCSLAPDFFDSEFLIIDSGGVRLRDRQCLAVLGDLFRIDRDFSVSIVRSFNRVRTDYFVGNLPRMASC